MKTTNSNQKNPASYLLAATVGCGFNYRTTSSKLHRVGSNGVGVVEVLYDAVAVSKNTGHVTPLLCSTNRAECKRAVETHKARQLVHSLEATLETFRKWHADGDTTDAEHADAVRTTVRRIADAKARLDKLNG